MREMAHNFAEKEMRPVAWEYDKDGTWPQEIIEKAWEVGLMNTHIPEEYGGALTEEPKLASFCLTEPDAGSDVSGMKTTAVRQGDKYILNGSKCFITNGSYADYYTVYAKTDKDAGHKGISAFVVEREWDGVTVDKKEDKLGQRASNTATISFNDVEVPAENLIGEENRGFKLAMMTLDRTRRGRVRARLLEGARPVRRADRHAPGDPVHDRRHGDRG